MQTPSQTSMSQPNTNAAVQPATATLRRIPGDRACPVAPPTSRVNWTAVCIRRQLI